MTTKQSEAVQPPSLPEQQAVTGLAEASREDLEKSYELCAWALTRILQEYNIKSIVLYPTQITEALKLWYRVTPDGGLEVELRKHEG